MAAHHPDGSAGVADQLERSRGALMDAIAGLDEEGFRTRRGGSSWTAAEVLAHLWTTEATLMQRTRPAPAADERDEARRLAQCMPVPQIIHALIGQRRTTMRALAGRSAGEPILSALCAEIARHEVEHAAAVRATREAAAPRT